MPYIRQEDRAPLEHYVVGLVAMIGKDPGKLNYVISRLAAAFASGERYEKLNAAIGAIECAKLECYRRIAAPYEDRKIIENGDVFD